MQIGHIMETATATDGTKLDRTVTWIASDGSGFESEWVAQHKLPSFGPIELAIIGDALKMWADNLDATFDPDTSPHMIEIERADIARIKDKLDIV